MTRLEQRRACGLCITCGQPAVNKTFCEIHRLRNQEYQRSYQDRHRDQINRKHRELYASDPEPFKQRSARHHLLHPKRRSELYEKRKPLRNAQARERLRNDPVLREENKHRLKQWCSDNKDYVREYARLKMARYAATKLDWLMKKRLRNRIAMALVGNAKSGSTMELLGCSIADFKIYLESKFDSGMSWDNWGKGKDKWNLDHIVPCALFDLTKPEHQKRCFHFSNYQPLWELDNISKGTKSSGQFQLL